MWWQLCGVHVAGLFLFFVFIPFHSLRHGMLGRGKVKKQEGDGLFSALGVPEKEKRFLRPPPRGVGAMKSFRGQKSGLPPPDGTSDGCLASSCFCLSRSRLILSLSLPLPCRRKLDCYLFCPCPSMDFTQFPVLPWESSSVRHQQRGRLQHWLLFLSP